MKKVLVRLLAVFGAICLAYIVVFLIVFLAHRGTVPGNTILEANFEKQMVEEIPDSPVAQATLSDRIALRDVVDALDRGASDDRVKGLVARIGASPMGMAQIQELREAVMRFRSHKKFAIAFSETFGEVGPGNGAYYLATAFDQIYLQPSGDIGLTGFILESPFIKGTLEKLGTKFHGDHRYEYKNALNFFTETKYTPPHKEAETALMNSWFGQLRDGVCQARGFPTDQFRAIVDKAPYLGKEAVTAKLVDGLAYRDEVYDQARKKAGQGSEFLYLEKYLDRAGRPHKKGKIIALVFGNGGVQRGKSDFNPVTGSFTMGSDTVAAALRAAAEEAKEVKAILFRVDSPGGSYVASDAIWREVAQARKAGKPVVVSMGDLAGSGGYFIAMNADKIVAQPGTITASIGVLGGKILSSGFWNKLGVSWDEVHDGANATIYTGTHDYSPAEWKRFEDWLDRVYADFTGKVAEGRKLPKERVLEIAKGRIWSGEDAKKLGLIDELGGYDTALKLAKQAANIPESEEVKIAVFPHKKTLLESILNREGPDNSDKEGAGTEQALIQVLRTIQPAIRQLQALGIDKLNAHDQGDDVLRMPQLEIGR